MFETVCRTAITRFSGVHAWLSNFYACDVSYAGLTFKSAEAAYQAAKTNDPLIRVRFTTASPREAKFLGRQIILREGWEEEKVDIMFTVVTKKFEQNPHLTKLLLDTDNFLLVEGNNWNDRFWGMSGGSGENVLGLILMLVRANLRRNRA